MAFAKPGFGRWLALCALTTACAAMPTARSATIATVAIIPGANDGSAPEAALTTLEGRHYGTTSRGGSTGGNAGTVFRIDLRRGVKTILHNFNGTTDGGKPIAKLLALSGKLYGTTTTGGKFGGGTVFAIDPVTGAEQVLYDLPAQTNAEGELAELGGLLYGIGQINFTIFSVDPVAARGQIVYSLASSRNTDANVSGLTRWHEALYGVSAMGGENQSGAIFRFDPATVTLRFVHSFGGPGDGKEPMASMIDVRGVLYGTTLYGGTQGYGTVFSFDPLDRQEKVVHSFELTDGYYINAGLLNVDGLLYGVAQSGGVDFGGVAFSIDPTNGQVEVIHEFDHVGQPFTSLIEAHGLLYGTLDGSGAAQEGEVYSVDPGTGIFHTAYDFAGPENSSNSGLIKVRASLYGTASGGGARGLGSIYRIDPGTGAVETLHSFSGADGARPMGALLDVDGILYGTTSTGGSSGVGTLFSFSMANHRLTTLHQFTNGTDGGSPVCTLSSLGGMVYGTTPRGDGAPFGTLFKFDIPDATFATVSNFSAGGLNDPYSGVIPVGGLLYGEASGGSGYGSLYQFDPSTAQLTVLYNFKGKKDGELPTGGLLYDNGELFGSTESQPQSSATIFSFDLETSTKTTLNLSARNENVDGPFVASGGDLFGIAYSSTATYGAVLRLMAAGGGVRLYPFANAANGYPEAPLLHVGRAYYGTTRSVGTAEAGTVFKFLP